MRTLMCMLVGCAVWFAAAQAMADVDAVIASPDDFCCVYGGIYVSAEGSTNWGEVDEIWWDFEDDGNWEIQYGDPTTYGTVFAQWTTGGIYTIRVHLVDYEGPEDDATATPFYVGEPIIATASYEVRAGIPVRFDGTGSKPTSMTRSYQWDFNNDGTWDSTSGTPDWTFSAGYHTIKLRVSYSSQGGYQGYCETTAVVHAT